MNDKTDYKELLNVPSLGDGIRLLQLLPENSVDLLIADLPWSHTADDYSLPWLRAAGFGIQVVELLPSVLSRNGSCYLMSTDFGINVELMYELNSTHLIVRNWIVWNGCTYVSNDRQYNSSALHILYITKNNKHTFNIDAVATTPDDVWAHDSTLRMGTNEVLPHSGQLPIALYERMIAMSSNPNDLIVDPCAGTFTIGVAAQKLSRRWIACDTSMECIDMGCDRLGTNEYNEI